MTSLHRDIRNLRHPAAVLLLPVLLLAVSCGKTEPSHDPAPFRKAIARYLDEHGMGMRVAEIKQLTVQDSTATAVVSMEHAEGIVGVKVRWTFSFEKRNGQWTAVRYEK